MTLCSLGQEPGSQNSQDLLSMSRGTTGRTNVCSFISHKIQNTVFKQARERKKTLERSHGESFNKSLALNSLTAGGSSALTRGVIRLGFETAGTPSHFWRKPQDKCSPHNSISLTYSTEHCPLPLQVLPW